MSNKAKLFVTVALVAAVAVMGVFLAVEAARFGRLGQFRDRDSPHRACPS